MISNLTQLVNVWSAPRLRRPATPGCYAEPGDCREVFNVPAPQNYGCHGISQNKVAIGLGVRGSVVYRWFHELIDPTGDTIAEIAKALQKLNPAAAEEFVRLYLGDFIQSGGQSKEEE